MALEPAAGCTGESAPVEERAPPLPLLLPPLLALPGVPPAAAEDAAVVEREEFSVEEGDAGVVADVDDDDDDDALACLGFDPAGPALARFDRPIGVSKSGDGASLAVTCVRSGATR